MGNRGEAPKSGLRRALEILLGALFILAVFAGIWGGLIVLYVFVWPALIK
jgi:D-alanyl-lipoteichoic acid acyltransferase DltB (MBOAT superfamily)